MINYEMLLGITVIIAMILGFYIRQITLKSNKPADTKKPHVADGLTEDEYRQYAIDEFEYYLDSIDEENVTQPGAPSSVIRQPKVNSVIKQQKEFYTDNVVEFAKYKR